MTDTTEQASASGLAYTAVTGLQYANSAGTAINATITFEGLGEVPYTLTAGDQEAHGAEIYAAAVAGAYGEISAYVPPASGVLEAQARIWRDSELAASQWLVERHRDQVEAGSATTLTTDQYSALQVYRQALRDWPMAADFPAASSRPAAPDWLATAEADVDATA